MVEVKVSEDGMLAEVSVVPEPGEQLTPGQVEDTIRLEGIQVGIDTPVINEMLEKKIYDQFLPIAKGKPPVNGQDGFFEFFFAVEEDERKPVIREDGSADYSVKIINVNEGDLLAEYHPETQGTFGYNLFSKILSPVKGKPKLPLRCKDVRLEENRYYAAKSGRVVLDGNALSIRNVLEVKGDTAYNDGNINFNGDVHVLGNICNGITVQATGSVLVDGVIENAKVYANHDVVVSRGIHGQGTTKDGMPIQDDLNPAEITTIVETRGNLKSKFIDHAFVKAEGDVFMDYSVGSVITSEGKVTAFGAKGAIIGGSITALLGVDAEVLGNAAELPTEIKVGDEKNFMKVYSAAREKLQEMEDAPPASQGQTEPEKLQEMKEQAKRQIEFLEQKYKEIRTAPVIVRRAFHPNVKLFFGKISVPDVSGKFNVEFRKIGGHIQCKTIGTFTEAELTYDVVDKNMQSSAIDKLTVLIIDDDTRLLRTVNNILENDYQVAVATSGRVGRKYLEKNSADLILLDYMMPEENGVEVLKSLRANDETKNIPVVFLTGLDDKKKILEFLSLRPAGYILKPVERESLLAKIHAILGDKE